ncbi:unnamed protein product, partial [Dovyalis caffra]
SLDSQSSCSSLRRFLSFYPVYEMEEDSVFEQVFSLETRVGEWEEVERVLGEKGRKTRKEMRDKM